MIINENKRFNKFHSCQVFSFLIVVKIIWDMMIAIYILMLCVFFAKKKKLKLRYNNKDEEEQNKK